ncbi:Uncharacterized protein FWK35_00013151 [Aphis craccivora]|uniref:Uncharacterized protein n=1 Tax=Aphis craccivora TaxID=307492 RepID=A0A6G0Z9T1_APHCR|nr:Uncharacterized protein FWK35_00013151 [Aphis craccivora]
MYIVKKVKNLINHSFLPYLITTRFATVIILLFLMFYLFIHYIIIISRSKIIKATAAAPRILIHTNSERSDDRIITSRNNAPISTLGVVSDVKVKNKHFPTVFKKIKKNKKKMTEKREFLRKTMSINFYDQKHLEISNFYEICRKPENWQRNDNDLFSNDFKYFISMSIKILRFSLQ